MNWVRELRDYYRCGESLRRVRSGTNQNARWPDITCYYALAPNNNEVT
jgi:predicted DNA-binding protein